MLQAEAAHPRAWLAGWLLMFALWRSTSQEKTYLSEVTDMPKKQINTWFTVCESRITGPCLGEFAGSGSASSRQLPGRRGSAPERAVKLPRG